LQWYMDGLGASDRVVLSKAITLIESSRPTDRALANQLLHAISGSNLSSVRIGISGPPGVGKSTMIEALGLDLIARGKRVAVLAIDPTSTVTSGSILGDKTRMTDLAQHSSAYIRPSAAGNTLGGVGRNTRETIALAEAAGFDVILIETVGVGQSEVTVSTMTDLFVLLLLPGAGDELQGIKRGIVELVDLCVVNKADHDQLDQAKLTQAHYLNALHVLSPKSHGQVVPVLLASARDKTGIDQVVNTLLQMLALHTSTGYLAQNRTAQQVYWWQEEIKTCLLTDFYATEGMQQLVDNQEVALKNGEISASAATHAAMAFYHKQQQLK
jgi:LAO/AO transport system kinase